VGPAGAHRRAATLCLTTGREKAPERLLTEGALVGHWVLRYFALLSMYLISNAMYLSTTRYYNSEGLVGHPLQATAVGSRACYGYVVTEGSPPLDVQTKKRGGSTMWVCVPMVGGKHRRGVGHQSTTRPDTTKVQSNMSEKKVEVNDRSVLEG
jgi:hypothetical protein